jgi:anti-anti-sigma factor
VASCRDAALTPRHGSEPEGRALTGYEWLGDQRRDDPPLEITVTHCNDGVVVQARGEIDLATRDVFEQEVRMACVTAQAVWLDLADVTFLDPQGARLLAQLQATHDGVRIASASKAVHRTAELVQEIEGIAALTPRGAEPECDVAPT